LANRGDRRGRGARFINFGEEKGSSVAKATGDPRREGVNFVEGEWGKVAKATTVKYLRQEGQTESTDPDLI